MLQRFLTALAAASSALVAGGCVPHHQHGDTHVRIEAQGLSVVGVAEVKSRPDIARATLGIEVRAETAEAATEQANQQMAAVIAALKAAGIADTDLRTNEFSVTYERMPVSPAPIVVQVPEKGRGGAPTVVPQPAPEPKGSYRVSNTVEVTVRDVSKTSAVLSAGTKAGANNVWGVSFDIADREPLHARAREQAIAKAISHAKALAQHAGVALGGIVTIDDQADEGQANPRMYAMRAEAADASAVPVESGELTVRHHVRLVYAIRQH